MPLTFAKSRGGYENPRGKAPLLQGSWFCFNYKN